MNDGLIQLDGASSGSQILISPNGANIEGGGTIRLSDSAANRIVSYGRLTQGTSHSIEGAGTIDLGASTIAQLTNRGKVIAVGANPLVISGSTPIASVTGSLTGDVVNLGVLQAGIAGPVPATGTLRFEGVAVNNLGGAIYALSGSTVNIAPTTEVHGGLIQAESGGAIDVAGQVFLRGGAMQALGTGRIEIASSGFVVGHGTIAGTLINKGKIWANESDRSLVIDAGGGVVRNEGTMEAFRGGRLKLEGGLFENLGTINAQPGSFIVLGPGYRLTGNQLGRDGTIIGTTLENVVLAPGQGTSIPVSSGGTFTPGAPVLSVPLGSTDVIAAGNPYSRTGGILVRGRLGIDGNVVFSGGNALVVDGGAVTSARAAGLPRSSSDPDRIINVNNLITGSGTISVDFSNGTNGLIESQGAVSHLTLSSATSAGSLNEGIIRARDNSSLTITGILNNSGSLIHVEENSRLSLSGLRLTGGLVLADESSRVTVTDSTLDTLILNAVRGASFDLNGATIRRSAIAADATGHYRVNASGGTGRTILQDVLIVQGATVEGRTGSSITLQGFLGNAGTVSTAGTIQVDGVVSLVGSGHIDLSPGIVRGAAGVVLASSPDRLVNIDNTISGGGSLGGNTLALTNAGLIEGTLAGTPLYLDLNNAGGLNTGTMRARDGGALIVRNGILENTGTIEALAGSQAGTERFGGIVGGEVRARSGGTIAVNGTIIDARVVAEAGGLIELNAGGKLRGGTIETIGSGIARTQAGSTGALDGVTIESRYEGAAGSTTTLEGTITNKGVMSLGGSSSDYSTYAVNGIVTLTGGGKLTMASTFDRLIGRNGVILSSSPDRLLNAADHTISGGGSLGGNTLALTNAGLIEGTLAGTPLYLDLNNAGGLNTGTMRARDGGALIVRGGVVDNHGLISAKNGSQVEFTGGSVANNVGGTLTGGTWASESSGGGSTLRLNGPAITQNAAEIIVSGAGSRFLTGAGGAALETTLATNTAAGTLRVLGGRDYVAGVPLTNAGRIELGGGTLDAAGLRNVASGEIFGFGTIAKDVTNSGTIRASGGTLSTARIIAASGTVRIDPGASLDLTRATGVSTAEFLFHNGVSLNLGANDFIVEREFRNTSGGSGNAFDPRANVSGTGRILAFGTTQQVLVGDVTGGAGAAPVMALGNVRVGGSVTKSFAIENQGTGGPALSGALQTAANGGSITASGLSGTGVSAQDFAGVRQGETSGAYTVTFAPTLAGALSGQKIAIVNGFDNVADQVLSVTGTAWNAASASAVGDVRLANRHVGTSATQSLAISNTAPAGAFTERLNASFGTVNGDARTNSAAISLLAPEGGVNTAMAVGIDTSTRGAKTGSVQVNFATDGTGTSGLAPQALPAQTVNVSGNVYALASGVVADAATVLDFGNVLRGSSQARTLAITNQGVVGDAFQEGLDARFGVVSGPGGSRYLTSGSITNLAAGRTDAASMAVRLDTSAAGSFSAEVPVEFTSNGSISGLGNTALGTTRLAASATITGVVGDLAAAGLTPTAINLGRFREGAADQTRALTVSNLLGGPGEGLNARFGAVSGGVTNNGGSITSLAPGASDASSMTVTLGGLGSAGAKSGTASVEFESDGSFNSGTRTALPTQSVTMSAEVYRLGAAAAPASVNLASRRVGDAAASASLAVTNTAAADGFSESLRVTYGAAPAGFTLGQTSPTVIAAGTTNDNSLTLSTAVAGRFSGGLTLGLASTGEGTSGLADLDLGSRTIDVDGKVYAPAVAALSSRSIDFGLRRVGDSVAPVAIDVRNGAGGALTDALRSTGTSAGGPFAATGPAAGPLSGAGLASGETQAGAFAFSMGTDAAGVFNGAAALEFRSTNPDMSDLVLNESVVLAGVVNNLARVGMRMVAGDAHASAAGGSFTIDFGTITQGVDVAAAVLRVLNDIDDALPGDGLKLRIGGLAPGSVFDVSGTFDAFVELGAGAGLAGLLAADLDTRAIGSYEDSFTIEAYSVNGVLADIALGLYRVALRGTVVEAGLPPADVPVPASWTLLALGAATAWGARRARRQARRAA